MMSEQPVPGSLCARPLTLLPTFGGIMCRCVDSSAYTSNLFPQPLQTPLGFGWAPEGHNPPWKMGQAGGVLRPWGGSWGALGRCFWGHEYPQGGIEEKHTCPSVPWTLFACAVGYCQEETRAGPSNVWGPRQRSLLPRSEGHSGPKQSFKTRYIMAPCELPNLISPSAPATQHPPVFRLLSTQMLFPRYSQVFAHRLQVFI